MTFLSIIAVIGSLQVHAGDIFTGNPATGIAKQFTCYTTNISSGVNAGNASAVSCETISSASVTVVITSSQDGKICAGSVVTFTATVVNGGDNPFFQWKINGANTGSNSIVFATADIKNGDKISCTVTSNSPLVSDPMATSNEITVAVGAFVVPDIIIVADPGNSICENMTVTFTAKAVDAAASPYYQWKVNGTYTGTNNPTFTTNSLVDGDIVSCDLTNLICNMTTLSRSNNISMIVTQGISPSVSITASETNVCKGVAISFSAASQNAGNNPAYQWKVNGTTTGSNQTFSAANLSDKDVVQCLLQPEQAGCAGAAGVNSNAITVTILPSPEFVITPGQPVISTGDSIKLSATGTNIVSYEWRPAQYISNTAISDPKVWPDQSKTYTVKATSDNNCSVIKEITVSVVSDLFIPSAFTPNNDGLNDTWKIAGIELYPGCTISIFNRSGNIVFRSAGYGTPWNGSYKGSKLSNGTFVYLINLGNDKKPLCGTVTIIR